MVSKVNRLSVLVSVCYSRDLLEAFFFRVGLSQPLQHFGFRTVMHICIETVVKNAFVMSLMLEMNKLAKMHKST